MMGDEFKRIFLSSSALYFVVLSFALYFVVLSFVPRRCVHYKYTAAMCGL